MSSAIKIDLYCRISQSKKASKLALKPTEKGACPTPTSSNTKRQGRRGGEGELTLRGAMDVAILSSEDSPAPGGAAVVIPAASVDTAVTILTAASCSPQSRNETEFGVQDVYQGSTFIKWGLPRWCE